jgi:hypothetical protein
MALKSQIALGICVLFLLQGYVSVCLNVSGSAVLPDYSNIQPIEMVSYFNPETFEIEINFQSSNNLELNISKTVLEKKKQSKIVLYDVTDSIENELKIKIKLNSETKSETLKIIEMQYNNNDIINLTNINNIFITKYAIEKDGSYKSFTQKIKYDSEYRLESTYKSNKNLTVIRIVDLTDREKSVIQVPGFVYFYLQTVNGALSFYANMAGNVDTDSDGLTDIEELLIGTDPRNPDTDSDGMSDGWEVDHGFDPLTPDATNDFDSDGLLNYYENLIGTDQFDSDSDNDGLLDGEEIFTYLTDPLNSDSDNDGLTDYQEVGAGTDPNEEDSDFDGILDSSEPGWNMDPDGDGLISALDIDSDNDNMPDGWEYDNGLNTQVDDSALDTDGDGLSNLQEYNLKTSPTVADSDYDGVIDGDEISAGTNVLYEDSDNDGVLDGIEPDWNLDTDGDGLINALDTDSDNDGLDDGQEASKGTNPLKTDTDNDGVCDNEDPNPLKADSDDDGLTDSEEASFNAKWIEAEDLVDGSYVVTDEQAFNGKAIKANEYSLIDSDFSLIKDNYKVILRAKANTLQTEDFSDISEWTISTTESETVEKTTSNTLPNQGEALHIKSLDGNSDGKTQASAIFSFTDSGIEEYTISFDYMPRYSKADKMNNFLVWGSWNSVTSSYDGVQIVQSGDILTAKIQAQGIQGDFYSVDFLRWYHFDIQYTGNNGGNIEIYVDGKLAWGGPKLPGTKLSSFGHLGDVSIETGYGEAYWDNLKFTAGSPITLGITNGGNSILSDTHILSPEYRWYSSPTFTITDVSEIKLSIDQIDKSSTYSLVSIDELAILGSDNFFNSMTNPLNKDTDGDGILDGNEAKDGYWFEAEDYSRDPSLIKDNWRASNSKVVKALTGGLDVLINVIPVPAAGNYHVYIRASTDWGIGRAIHFTSLINYEGHQNNVNVGPLTSDLEWYYANNFNFLGTGPLTITLTQDPETVIIIDKILLIKSDFTPIDVSTIGPMPGIPIFKGNHNDNWRGFPPDFATTSYAGEAFPLQGIWVSWELDQDHDNDGLGDYYELTIAKTDPTNQDTDGDGTSDGVEFGTQYSYDTAYYSYVIDKPKDVTDPFEPDSDGDLLTDGAEFDIGSNPMEIDTDQDGLTDGWEVVHGWDPVNGDADDDGLLDIIENRNLNSAIDDSNGIETDMMDDDTDNDGIIDGNEDININGLYDLGETSSSWKDENLDGVPDGVDSDLDGITDSVEIGLTSVQGEDSATSHSTYYINEEEVEIEIGENFVADADPSTVTDPTKMDTDGDGLNDGAEDFNCDGARTDTETRSDLADTDSDNIDDRNEKETYFTDPNNPDTDGDGLSDGAEIKIYGTNAKQVDTDGDSLIDSDEVLLFGTKPTSPFYNVKSNEAVKYHVVAEYSSSTTGVISINPFTPGSAGHKDIPLLPGSVGGYMNIEASGSYNGVIIQYYYDFTKYLYVPEDSLHMYYWNENMQEWTILTDSGVNLEKGYVWGKSSHLTSFTIRSDSDDTDLDGIGDATESDKVFDPFNNKLNLDDLTFQEYYGEDLTTTLDVPVLGSGMGPRFDTFKLLLTGKNYDGFIKYGAFGIGLDESIGTYTQAIGDYESDGVLDVASVNFDSNGNYNTIFLWSKIGTVGGRIIKIDTPTGAMDRINAMAFGDFDGDKKDDLVYVYEHYNDRLIDLSTVRIKVLATSGTMSPDILETTLSHVQSVDLGDVNNDGQDDIVIGSDDGIAVFYRQQIGESVADNFKSSPDVFLGYSFNFGKGSYVKVAIGDVYNHDGKNDIVFTLNSGNYHGFGIAYQDSIINGISSSYFYSYTGFSDCRDVEIGDFNQDGEMEIFALVTASSSVAGILVWKHTPAQPVPYATNYYSSYIDANSYDLELGHFNNDKYIDLAIARPGDFEDVIDVIEYNSLYGGYYYPDYSIPIGGYALAPNIFLHNGILLTGDIIKDSSGLTDIIFGYSFGKNLNPISRGSIQILFKSTDKPTNLEIDVGADGDIDWYHNGEIPPGQTADITDAINTYVVNRRDWNIPIDQIGNGPLSIPIKIHSGSIGLLEIGQRYSYLPGLDYETDPLNPDSDGDGLLDGRSIHIDVHRSITIPNAEWIAVNDAEKEQFNSFMSERIVFDKWGCYDDGFEQYCTFTFTGERTIGTVPTGPSIDDDLDGLINEDSYENYHDHSKWIDDDNDLYFDEDPNGFDSDADGLSDGREYILKMDPLVRDVNVNLIDHDGDGLTDTEESNLYFTDPLDPDTDGDGMSDGWEAQPGRPVQMMDPKKENEIGGRHVFTFALTFTFEWDVKNDYTDGYYLDNYVIALRRASNILYDATDGYFFLAYVKFYDNNQNAGQADFVVKPGDAYIKNIHIVNWPQAPVGGIAHPGLHGIMPWHFNHVGPDVDSYSNTLAHELCHYLLFADDEYQTAQGTDDIPAANQLHTIMANENLYTELSWYGSYQNPPPNTRTDTAQYDKVLLYKGKNYNHLSSWERLFLMYDRNVGAFTDVTIDPHQIGVDFDFDDSGVADTDEHSDVNDGNYYYYGNEAGDAVHYLIKTLQTHGEPDPAPPPTNIGEYLEYDSYA